MIFKFHNPLKAAIKKESEISGMKETEIVVRSIATYIYLKKQVRAGGKVVVINETENIHRNITLP